MKPVLSKSETGPVSETGYGQHTYVGRNFGSENRVVGLSSPKSSLIALLPSFHSLKLPFSGDCEIT